MDILALLVLVAGEFGLDPESMRTEVVTLCLEQVGREVLGAVAIVEAECGAESGRWDTPERTLGDNTTKS